MAGAAAAALVAPVVLPQPASGAASSTTAISAGDTSRGMAVLHESGMVRTLLAEVGSGARFGLRSGSHIGT
ncbi:hypothetical protein GCM10009839_02220 [Catenulispora yoronensis]|uniref:Uncharacterized protein n=1 Tax=Catenulispora yoronensis TaxID=450799 RepID=A0ABP5EYC3_9ACTN